MDKSPIKRAIDRMRTSEAIALIDLARDLVQMQQGSLTDALDLLGDGAGLTAAERDVVAYWIGIFAED